MTDEQLRYNLVKARKIKPGASDAEMATAVADFREYAAERVAMLEES